MEVIGTLIICILYILSFGAFSYLALGSISRMYNDLPAILAAFGTAFRGLSCVLLHDDDYVWIHDNSQDSDFPKTKELGTSTADLMQTRDASIQTEEASLEVLRIIEQELVVKTQELARERQQLWAKTEELDFVKQLLRKEREEHTTRTQELQAKTAESKATSDELTRTSQRLTSTSERLEELLKDDVLVQERLDYSRLRLLESNNKALNVMYNDLEAAYFEIDGLLFTFEFIHRDCDNKTKALPSDHSLAARLRHEEEAHVAEVAQLEAAHVAEVEKLSRDVTRAHVELWNCQASLNADAKELATARDELETTEAIFQANMEELGEELGTAKLALEKCQGEKAALQGKITELTKVAVAKFKAKCQQYRELQSELQTVNSTVAKGQEENAALRSELTNQQVAAKAGRADLEQQIVKLVGELAAKSEELEYAKKQLPAACDPVSTPAATIPESTPFAAVPMSEQVATELPFHALLGNPTAPQADHSLSQNYGGESYADPATMELEQTWAVGLPSLMEFEPSAPAAILPELLEQPFPPAEYVPVVMNGAPVPEIEMSGSDATPGQFTAPRPPVYNPFSITAWNNTPHELISHCPIGVPAPPPTDQPATSISINDLPQASEKEVTVLNHPLKSPLAMSPQPAIASSSGTRPPNPPIGPTPSSLSGIPRQMFQWKPEVTLADSQKIHVPKSKKAQQAFRANNPAPISTPQDRRRNLNRLPIPTFPTGDGSTQHVGQIARELFGVRGAWGPIIQLWMNDHLFDWDLRLYPEEANEFRVLDTQIHQFLQMLREKCKAPNDFAWILNTSGIGRDEAVAKTLFSYFCHLRKTTNLPWFQIKRAIDICWSCEDIIALCKGALPDVNLWRREKPQEPAERVEGAGKRKEEESGGGDSKRRHR